MEDFIFDDDVDEVGAEVEAHCPKCKTDTTHVVISKYEDEIRKVQCNPCGDVHAYRKPRGETAEDEAEPTPKKKAAKAKPTWDQIMAKSKKPPRAYALSEYFKELEIVSHPKFGVGYVTENIGADKIEVTFKEDKRVLVHNRKGLVLPISGMAPVAQRAPSAAPAPDKAAKGGKAAKGKGGKPEAKAEAPVAAPVKTAPPPAVKGKAPAAPAKAPVAAKPAAKPTPVAAKGKPAPAATTGKGKAPAAVKGAARPAAKKPATKSAAAPKGKAKPAARPAAKPQSKAKPAARAKVAAKRR